MWGMGGWTGSDDEESLRALDRAFALGCNFFDTAWAYGQGKSETLLGQALRAHRGRDRLRRHQDPAEEHEVAGQGGVPGRRTPIRPITSASTPRRASGTSACRRSICSSSTSGATRGPTTTGWQRAVDDLKREKLVRAVGISVNRWEADQRAARARRPG